MHQDDTWSFPCTEIRVSDCPVCERLYVARRQSLRQICTSTTCRNKRHRMRVSASERKAAEQARYRERRSARQRFVCEWCGVEFGSWKQARFCSPEHAAAAKVGVPTGRKGKPNGRRTRWPQSRISVVECSGCGNLAVFPGHRKHWKCHEDCGRERHCESCGGSFLLKKWQAGQQKYCSATCMHREARTVRRARKMKTPSMAPVIRAKIYERDGWRCQICRRPVKRGAMPPHQKAPTLDHIIPLARGGTHEPVNCQLACYRCNCLKGDRTGPAGDQLRLIG